MPREGSRDLKKEKFWRRMIGGQARSGLSISGWCRRHRPGVCPDAGRHGRGPSPDPTAHSDRQCRDRTLQSDDWRKIDDEPAAVENADFAAAEQVINGVIDQPDDLGSKRTTTKTQICLIYEGDLRHNDSINLFESIFIPQSLAADAFDSGTFLGRGQSVNSTTGDCPIRRRVVTAVRATDREIA